ncbi:MAG: Flp family type IVb pilin [Bryobacterales bacterium]|nr:Flp family type IVb pilin [Bryobacterales bacterium]
MDKKSNFRLWIDSRGQDIIEYSLVAGFLAVVAVAIGPTLWSAAANLLARLPD